MGGEDVEIYSKHNFGKGRVVLVFAQLHYLENEMQ